jgi:hypothetical protein
MINWKLGVRKATTAGLRLMPAPLVRYVLKSYFYNQDMQNRLGFHIQPFRYNCAIADITEIDTSRLTVRRPIPGFPADLSVYFPLLNRLKPYAPEIQAYPKNPDGKSKFWFHNAGYEDFDAVTHYGMLRHLKPRRMIEVGCGFSSRLTTFAAQKNAGEGSKLECLFIEPAPMPHLRDFERDLGGPLRISPIQKVPLDEFRKLQSGDVLFIDTSHVLKTQDDLCYILIEILPALAAGVYLSFHDIFTPFDYPEYWLLQIGFNYNEQYALEAILANNPNFEILLPMYALFREQRPKLAELLPGGELVPAAYWFRKK